MEEIFKNVFQKALNNEPERNKYDELLLVGMSSIFSGWA
jgi:hypothetical protein